MNIQLLIIDPENDFCDKKGSLYVAGADMDMSRLATMIKRTKLKLDDIHVTMDEHHLVDIAHAIYWVDSHGKHPNPFTIISAADVKKGIWKTFNPQFQASGLDYVETLQKNGRYPLCIWPDHCLIGSWGASVYPPVFEALLDWESDFNMVDYVTKGSNYKTEHYSAVQADVPDTEDPGTMLNHALIKVVKTADMLLLAGEALSHCLAYTVGDIADNFGEDNIKKMVLLRDATSPVPNPPFPGAPDFVGMGEEFIRKMKKRGMQVSTTTEILK
jgi:nicotinamidase/pyrazinamidase